MSALTKKIKIKVTMTLLSGLHIGASSDAAQIGGVDKPIIRRKDNNQPYIPGSSIKGKIRCLLEQSRGAIKVGDNDTINQLFGITGKNTISSKIIVRDAYLDSEIAQLLNNSWDTDLPYSEVKFENSINRQKGTADNPRQIERIPAGAKFNLEFIINVWNGKEQELLDLFYEGINLLENDYLGGNGSRGYGHVELELKAPETVFETNKQSSNA